VFIPKANGKLRLLGISTVRDRVCMTAAMLVLEPIFEADLPPEQYAYRPGHNAQQALVKVEELMFRGHKIHSSIALNGFGFDAVLNTLLAL
jgi:retron-type reverse transcriptase